MPSLLNWAENAAKTVVHAAQAQAAAHPQPVARPGMSVQPVQRPQFVQPHPVAPHPQAPMPVRTAAPQILRVGQQQVAPTPNRQVIADRYVETNPFKRALQLETHNPLTNSVGGAAKGLVTTGYNITKATPLNPANDWQTLKAAADLASGNTKAAGNAFKPVVKNVHGGTSAIRGFAQGTVAQGYQLGESLNPYGGDVYDRVHTPTGGFQKFVLGSSPIPSMQKQFRDTQKTQGNGQALSDISLTALMDAAGGKGIVKGVEALPKTATAAATSIKNLPGRVAPKAQIAKDMISMTPRVTLQDQRALKAYSDHVSGVKPADQATLQTAMNAAQKHGIDITSGPVATRLENTNKILDTIGQKNKAITEGGQTPVDGPLIPTGKLFKDKSKTAETTPTPQLPAEVKPATVPAGTVSGGALADNTPTQTKFTKTVKNSPEFSPETKAGVDSHYTADTMDAAMNRAKDSITNNGLQPTLNKTLAELNTRRGTAGRDTLAHAIELAKIHDALGTESGHATAAQLLNLAAEHGSALGQGTQILAAIARRSPAGLRNKAFNDLKEAGIDVTKPENAHIRNEIQGHIDTVASMKDGPARDLAIAVLQKAVAKHLPQSAVDNTVSLWKAGLLSGVKTQQGNAISNATFGAMKKVSDIPATGVDKAISLATGKRTKTMTSRGILSGTGEGTKNGIFTMKTGIDKRSVGDKYEQHGEINFGNKVLQTVLAKPANTIFRGMSAADQPFWYASLKNSLYDQAKADGLNRGLHGQALLDHMDNMVKNPNERMADTATAEANKSTLNYDTVGSKAIQAAHRGIDSTPGITPAGAKFAHSVLNVIAPFVRVPTAFLSRTIDFTPLGVGKEVFHQVASVKFDQRALSQAIGEGLTGTGAIALGVALTQHNLLSGDFPKNDAKEQQRWKAEGITPNSVKLGGKWISLNYMGPLGLLFNAGNKLENAKGEGATTQVGTAIGGFGQGLMGQSFLQGFSGFSNAIQDPNRNLKSFVNSQASSIVPAISNDVANATDSMQRQADTVTESIKNRIPGLRETNKPKQDIYGNPLKQPSGKLGTLIGFKPSASLTGNSPAINEVNRLHTVDPNNADLQVTPTAVDKKITIPGANKGDKSTIIPLNDKQRYDYQKAVGQATQANWNKLIQTPEYKAMTDAEKAKKLTAMRQDSTELATRQFVIDNKLGDYSKAASKSAITLAGGDISKYTSTSDGSTTGIKISPSIDKPSKDFLTSYNKLDAATRTKNINTQPDYEYKLKAAQYANDKANGKITAVQDISRQAELATAKVGSAYSKDVRDAYSLSKAHVADYLNTLPTTQADAVYKNLVAYDQALYDNGINSTLKFKYGLGTKGKSTGSSRRSGSSTKVASSRKTGAGSRGGKVSSALPKMAKIKLPKQPTLKTPHFATHTPKAPSFKTSHQKLPTYAYKTPKVTTRKRALA